MKPAGINLLDFLNRIPITRARAPDDTEMVEKDGKTVVCDACMVQSMNENSAHE